MYVYDLVLNYILWFVCDETKPNQPPKKST